MTLAEQAALDLENVVLNTDDFAVTVSIERASEVPDASGASTVTWAPHISGLVGIIEPVRTMTADRIGRTEIETTHRFSCRSTQAVTGMPVTTLVDYFHGVPGQVRLRLVIVGPTRTRYFEIRNAFNAADASAMIVAELTERELGWFEG